VDGVRKVVKSVRGVNEPEMVESDNGLVLTPHGRWQVVQGLAKPVIRYEGDPDLSPITHGEVVWLVRALYQASLWLNRRWAEPLHLCWCRGGVWGRVARLVLAPPTHYYTVAKSISGGHNTREMHRHNARISLRPLASKKVLLYLAIYCSILLLCGYSITSSLTILLILSTILLCTMASIQSLTQAPPSLLDTSDLVLEDTEDKKSK
jgi:sphingomyelin phosphodiesterase 4